jgi:hypothetical protein
LSAVSGLLGVAAGAFDQDDLAHHAGAALDDGYFQRLGRWIRTGF